ncbi:RsmB/NOP family class I SAM-dependent RNA methyltransferase [Thalassolituus sp.]|uniref:RsmB/NOP family class I SAM-dependent RNA methyltransferase n=1 Tax=Thalassolituus sp. TaxID=2030822 RepID=UPI002A80BC42|nr:RsmB/NOP family class I SAM-dependent RNA methyltransferase [Thalassolituus sp.]
MSSARQIITYEQLHSLWLRWQAMSPRPPLDRWLKQHAAGWRRHQGEPMPMAVSDAMIQGVRYMQLACALEAVQRQGANIDWMTWDDTWQPDDSDQLSRNNFWYWIHQRCEGRWRVPQDWNSGSRKQCFIDFQERAMSNPLSPEWMLWHGLRPQWLPLLQQRAERSRWSDMDLQRFVEQQSARPPLWLRINTNESPEAILPQLLDAGIQADIRNGTLCAQGGNGLQQSEPYKAGKVEIQDLASQQLSNMVAARKGDKVWDCCAGAGGKTLAIASRMEQKGVVVATDLHQFKLDELKRRAKRASYLNIRTFTWDAEAPLRLPAEVARQQGFDWVLIDAPCTASGTWRRNADARWRFDASDSAEMEALQQKILNNACAAVRKGGHMVYATCSWQLSENEEAVATFLANHPEFTLESQQMVGAPQQDADCMFVAKMTRMA